MGNIEVSKENIISQTHGNQSISHQKTNQKQLSKVAIRRNHSAQFHCRAQFCKVRPPFMELKSEDQIKGEQSIILEAIQKDTTEASELEDFLTLEAKKHGRIEVNWSSFVKIKKKNYLEQYVFVKEIGKGAFGTVAKIKMKYGTCCRAVKIVKQAAMIKQSDTRQKLFAEISIPIELDHPNIAKMYEVFSYKKSFALVMELCQGGDLFHYIKANRVFTESSAAAFLKQIISAVYYMHKKGICHRDLKPQNMLYDTESQQLKIIDFGTAARLENGQYLSNLVGTPYYIAPEVLSGKYNQKCDVWSCGIILFIILSGSPPFQGKNQREIFEKIKLMPIEFNTTIWGKRSPQCKELIINMLFKDPDRRFTAEQVLNSGWIQKSKKGSVVSDPQIGKHIVKNLKNFHFQNKLKAVVYTYIASQLYSNKDKQKLLAAFKQIDRDGDGVIQKNQLIKIFNQAKTTLSLEEVEKILELIDTNGSGRIDFTQFLVAASDEEQLLKRKQLESAFSYLDSDHSGYITFQQIQAFLDNSDQTIEQIKNIFKQVDENGDGKISKNEFISLLVGDNKS